ncbi:MAG: TetR/AcrR family transcriptional regulator [Lachnotalea sp.]
MANDARIRYTKMRIQNAFIKLLDEIPLNKITVKEVCKIAQINRATFYRYYKDPYDWIEQMENTFLSNARNIIVNINHTNNYDIFTQFLEKMRDRKELLHVLRVKYGDKAFYENFLSSCMKEIIEKSENENLFTNDEHPRWKEHFLTYGCHLKIVDFELQVQSFLFLSNQDI